MLINGDCLIEMGKLENDSIDLVLTDPPYGTTQCRWDNVIPFEPMWKQLKRITKDNGAICLFGSEPFSSHLRLSNLRMYKYDWIWQKTEPTGMLNAKRRPMFYTEIISVFNSKFYYPQKVKIKPYKAKMNASTTPDIYGEIKDNSLKYEMRDWKYPSNIIKFKKDSKNKKLHPTQKPVPLLEYLIKTYTKENETVLDFTMGSGSTGVACKNLGRKFIGVELDKQYFDIAKKRIANVG